MARTPTRQTIPAITDDVIDPYVFEVLEPLRSNLASLLQGRDDDKPITRGDLVKLGLATQSEVDAL